MWRHTRILQDFDQKIREHIEMATRDNIDSGMSAEEVRHAALRKFGNVTRVKEDTREVWNIVWLDQLLQDIRFGLRVLRNSPGFAAGQEDTHKKNPARGKEHNDSHFSPISKDARALAVLYSPYSLFHQSLELRLMKSNPSLPALQYLSSPCAILTSTVFGGPLIAPVRTPSRFSLQARS